MSHLLDKLETIFKNKIISENLEYNEFKNELENLDYEQFVEFIEEKINEIEIVYNSQAIEFLAINDNSLQKSIDLAEELGYNINQINSIILATLLLRELIRKEFYSF